VKNKMNKGDGMSYAEFSYPILQAWDWWTMYETNKIQMQIGGSDQFGNITAGIDAVKYIAATHHDPVVREEVATQGPPFGFTVPLLTTSSGQKFGKSAGNAVWLDKDQTSSFELYKFFLGTSDADIGRYLKLFTFMPVEQIDALVEEHMESPSQRRAQHKLAQEFVELVHGEKESKYAESQHRLIFAKNKMTPEEYAAAQAELANIIPPSPTEPPQAGIVVESDNRLAAHLKLPRKAVEGVNIGKILLACGLATSSTEGHRLAEQQAVYVGGLKGGSEDEMVMNDVSLTFTSLKAWRIEDTQKYIIDDKLLIFRRGKSFIKIIEVMPDAEYEALGLSYPGMRKPLDSEQEGGEDIKEKGAAY
jgi:tyrosyl-tRNA synthetase